MEGWIALADHRPLPAPGPALLVTNNVDARTAQGFASHVWLVRMIHYGENAPDSKQYRYPMAFSEAGGEVLGVTHWRHAIPEEVS